MSNKQIILKSDGEFELLANIANYAYRHSRNRENAIALMLHYNPSLPTSTCKLLWETIDAYENNDQTTIKVLPNLNKK